MFQPKRTKYRKQQKVEILEMLKEALHSALVLLDLKLLKEGSLLQDKLRRPEGQ